MKAGQLLSFVGLMAISASCRCTHPVQNVKNTKLTRVEYPSDLEQYPSNAFTPYSMDWVLREQFDFRLLYCDWKTLQKRVASGVCVVDYADQSFPSHAEVRISPGTPLTNVLTDERIDLARWQWRRVKLISPRMILSFSRESDFSGFKVSPGDFIIVTPIDY